MPSHAPEDMSPIGLGPGWPNMARWPVYSLQRTLLGLSLDLCHEQERGLYLRPVLQAAKQTPFGLGMPILERAYRN
jgi:hypothetical protein